MLPIVYLVAEPAGYFDICLIYIPNKTFKVITVIKSDNISNIIAILKIFKRIYTYIYIENEIKVRFHHNIYLF